MECEHCSGTFEEISIDGSPEGLNQCAYITPVKPLLVICESFENGVDCTTNEYSIKINYCPICGRKLTKSE